MEVLESGREMKSCVSARQSIALWREGAVKDREDVGLRLWDFQMKTGQFRVNSLVALGHGSPNLG